MTWAHWVPALAVAVAFVVVPGAVLGIALGLRLLPAVAFAPALSTGLVVMTSLVSGSGALPWGTFSVVVVTVAAVLLAGCVRFLARAGVLHPATPPRHRGRAEAWGTWLPPLPERRSRRRSQRRMSRRDIWNPRVLAVAAVASCVLTALLAARALGRPDAISQTFDAVFHLNAVRWVLDTGAADPHSVSRMVTDGRDSYLYPAAWHALVSLVVPSAGGSIPAATNAVVMACLVLAWPLGLAVLARQALGPGSPPLVAVVLSTAFVGGPWLLLEWGVLYPQLLGTLLAGPVVAAGLSLVGAARNDVLGNPARAATVLVVASLACVLAHPGAFLGGVVLGVCVLVWQAGVVSARALRRRRWRLVPIGPIALVVVPLVAYRVALALPGMGAVRAFDWPTTDTVWGAVRQAVTLAPNRGPAAWALAVLVLAGLVAALRDSRAGWLVPGMLALSTLDVLAVASDGALAQDLTGFWYNDRYRLVSLVPVAAVPLAAAGARALAGLRRVPWRRTLLRPAVVLAVSAATFQGTAVGAHAVATRHSVVQRGDEAQLVDEAEQRFYARLDDVVRPGEVVAASPWTGASLVYALSGRRVLFPHFTGYRSPEQRLLAEQLRAAPFNPAACDAAARLRVAWVVEDAELFRIWPHSPVGYPGLQRVEEFGAVERVDGVDGVTLYRLRPCPRSDGTIYDASG